MTFPRLEIVERKKFLGFFFKTTYRLLEDHVYTCKKTGRTLTSRAGDLFDGATGALDANPAAWVPHDTACRPPSQWDNGDPITAKEAAGILKQAHAEVGNNVRSFTWPAATFLFGCHNVRKNGWFRRKPKSLERPLRVPDDPPAPLPFPEDEEGVKRFLEAAGIEIKPGVSVGGLNMQLMTPVLRAAVAEIPEPVVITSAVRPETGGGFSYHHIGRALDFRSRHLNDNAAMEVGRKIKGRLPDGYHVLVKFHPPHIHVEADRV